MVVLLLEQADWMVTTVMPNKEMNFCFVNQLCCVVSTVVLPGNTGR